MGRLPPTSVKKFEEFFIRHKFNVYDIMTYDSKNEIFDSLVNFIANSYQIIDFHQKSLQNHCSPCKSLLNQYFLYKSWLRAGPGR